MIPWSLRAVDRRRWRQAQEHEARFWTQPNALPPQSERVSQRYAGLLRAMEGQGPWGEVILEVGSGPTCATRVLSGVRRVFADPLATVYRSLCPDSIPDHFVASTGEHLPFRDATFDGVFSFNVIDHVFSPAQFVGELVRVARSGGTIMIGVYTHPRLFAAVRTALERTLPWIREPAHPFFFSRESLVRLLRHHHLHVERVVCAYAPQRFAFLHRQDWVAIARKPLGPPG